jgi:hypothetical protein
MLTYLQASRSLDIELHDEIELMLETYVSILNRFLC